MLLYAFSFLAIGCVGDSTGPKGDLTARLSVATVLPDGASSQAIHVDGWRVQVTRPGGGVIGEDSGSVGPGESTMDIAVTVELNASCETLGIGIELSSLGEVWFRSNENHLICLGTQSQIQVAELEFVRPSASVSPGSLDLLVQEGGVTAGEFLIQYGGSDGLAWSAWVEESDAGWLTLAPTAGSATSGLPSPVQILVDAAALTPGDYSAHIAVAGEGFPDLIGRVPVSLSVTPGPRLGISPGSLSFSASPGVTPGPKTFTVTNLGGGTLSWTAADNAGWLGVVPASGSLGPGENQLVTVVATPDALPAGDHEAAITVSAEGAWDSPQTVSVTLTKTTSPRFGLSTGSLSFSAPAGTNPASQTVTVTNVGGGLLAWNASVDVSWLGLEPGSGVLGEDLNQSVAVSVNSAGLDPGSYEGTITFSDPEADNSPQTVSVSLTLVGDLAPEISGLSWTQLVLNDPTCGNDGTRFELSFDFSDLDGDVQIAGDSLSGKPITLDWWFRPDGFSGSSPLTAAVDGTKYSGSLTFQMCIAYQVPENTSVDLTYTLQDAAGHESNSLSRNIPRPVGGNAPPPPLVPGVLMGAPGAPGKGGDVKPGGSGGGSYPSP